MTSNRPSLLTLLTVAFFGLSPDALAQVIPAPEATPSVVAAGRAEVLLTPDEATVAITIRTNAPDAAAASSRNEAIASAVVEAIEALDLSTDSVRLTNLRVYPNREYTPNGPRDAGFNADRSISVTTDAISDVGRIVSAALGAGATSIDHVAYSSSRSDDARADALAAAVRNARADAEIVAAAAGGRLGGVLLITTHDVSIPRPMIRGFGGDERAEMAAARELPDPEDISVSAFVTGQWAFVAGAER